jgi:hypothetical protein
MSLVLTRPTDVGLVMLYTCGREIRMLSAAAHSYQRISNLGFFFSVCAGNYRILGNRHQGTCTCKILVHSAFVLLS